MVPVIVIRDLIISVVLFFDGLCATVIWRCPIIYIYVVICFSIVKYVVVNLVVCKNDNSNENLRLNDICCPFVY